MKITKLDKTVIIYIVTFLILCFITSKCSSAEPAEDNALINALICVESGWRADAVSAAGCRGLMQINPSGALAEYNEYNRGRGHTPDDLFSPSINIKIGRWYLNRLKNNYLKNNFSLENLLAAYNGGITRLRKSGYDWTKMPEESRDYVKKVLKIYNGK